MDKTEIKIIKLMFFYTERIFTEKNKNRLETVFIFALRETFK